MDRIRELLAVVVICAGFSAGGGTAAGAVDESPAAGAGRDTEQAAAAESAGTLILLVNRPFSISEAQLRQVGGKLWPAADIQVHRGRVSAAAGLTAPGAAGEVFLVQAGGLSLSLALERTPLASAEEIPVAEDATVRRVLEQHRGWLSVAVSTAAESNRATMADCGRLLAALLEQRVIPEGVTCGLLVPAEEVLLPWGQIEGEALSLLRSEDPAAALRQRMNAPVLSAARHAVAVRQAAERARAGWADFRAAFAGRAATGSTGHSVLAEFTEGTEKELMWLEVRELRGGRVYGRLANQPQALRVLREGAAVDVSETAVLDWVFVNSAGDGLQGAFLSRLLKPDRTAFDEDRGVSSGQRR
ncbi:MAG: DUF2314 domain-containing protein [Planctomyces sp.]|nr:DUF2314 domain-containing protein [Planctomyces sp.]